METGRTSSYFFLAAFSAAFVTVENIKKSNDYKWNEHTLSTLPVGLLHRLDDTNSNSLPHVTDGKPTKGWVLIVRFHTHWLARDKLDDGSITGLDKLGRGFYDFATSTVDLLDQLGEFTSNVGGVAIKYGCVAGTDLTRVVEDNNLGVKRGSFLSRVVF